MSDSLFRIGADGFDDAETAGRCLGANRERRTKGLIEPGEVDRIALLELDVPRVSGPGGGKIVEALRLMQRSAHVAESAPITSHRPILGPVLVLGKRALRRILRFETAERWGRQEEFNRAVAEFARAVLAELGRTDAAKEAGRPDAGAPGAEQCLDPKASGRSGAGG